MITDKFHPAYLKFGKWYFCEENISLDNCNLWFKNQGIEFGKETTTLIVNNCNWCPKWMKNLYVRYQLISTFNPVSKKF